MSPLLLMLIVAVAVGMLLRLKRVSGLGETLATTLVGLATRIAVKVCAYTYAFMVNRMLNRPSRSHQGVVGLNLTTDI